MPNYHVGCGLFGIYAGTLEPKNPTMWRNKSEVTDEAIDAVRDYMLDTVIKDGKTEGGYEWTKKDGKIVQLIIKEIERKEEA